MGEGLTRDDIVEQGQSGDGEAPAPRIGKARVVDGAEGGGQAMGEDPCEHGPVILPEAVHHGTEPRQPLPDAPGWLAQHRLLPKGIVAADADNQVCCLVRHPTELAGNIGCDRAVYRRQAGSPALGQSGTQLGDDIRPARNIGLVVEHGITEQHHVPCRPGLRSGWRGSGGRQATSKSRAARRDGAGLVGHRQPTPLWVSRWCSLRELLAAAGLPSPIVAARAVQCLARWPRGQGQVRRAQFR
jgi:hypothetical protein